MITKSDITKAFNTLRKYGYLVAHFNDNRRGTKGNNGFPDMVIAGHGYLIFCEVKIGKDRFSPDQEKWKGTIIDIVKILTHEFGNAKFIQYFTVTEVDYTEIVDKILMRNF